MPNWQQRGPHSVIGQSSSAGAFCASKSVAIAPLNCRSLTMRRALARLAQTGLRAAAAAECEALATGSVRAAAIGMLNMQQTVPVASQWTGARTLFTTPAWAEADKEFNCVYYPEPEAEVGEAAPDFSLPGETLHRLLAAPRAVAVERACCLFQCMPTHSCTAAGQLLLVACHLHGSAALPPLLAHPGYQGGVCAGPSPCPASQPSWMARSSRCRWKTTRASTSSSSSTPRTSRERDPLGGLRSCPDSPPAAKPANAVA